MSKIDDVHNAHMHIPQRLWDEGKRIAILQGMTMTEFVCHAIAAAIREFNQERKEPDE